MLPFLGFGFWVESISLYFSSAPGVTRTRGLLIRSQTLYPTELRAHAVESVLYRRRRNSAMPKIASGTQNGTKNDLYE
jgi:hypothetical protein